MRLVSVGVYKHVLLVILMAESWAIVCCLQC